MRRAKESERYFSIERERCRKNRRRVRYGSIERGRYGSIEKESARAKVAS
jgi:hypothetical protein